MFFYPGLFFKKTHGFNLDSLAGSVFQRSYSRHLNRKKPCTRSSCSHTGVVCWKNRSRYVEFTCKRKEELGTRKHVGMQVNRTLSSFKEAVVCQKTMQKGGRVKPNVNTARTETALEADGTVVGQDKSEDQTYSLPHELECWRHFEAPNLYLTSKRVESSSSSFSSLRGAISTRSAGVVMMSYLRVFLIRRPDLWGEKSNSNIRNDSECMISCCFHLL